MKLLYALLLLFAACNDSIDKISVSGNNGTASGSSMVISEKLCAKCNLCYEVCPRPGKALSTITINENETIYVIDPEQCLRCGLCMNKCPYGAITWKH